MANPNNITLRLASNGGVDRTLSYEEMDNNFKELVTSINDVASLDGEVTQSQSDISQLQSDVAEKLQVETYNSRVLREDLLNQATLSLDFANNKYAVYEGPVNSLTQMPFNEALDFTRASSATARTATGKIQEVLTDEQRLVGNREGLLIEEQRTNLHIHSQEFTNTATWNLSSLVAEDNSYKSPDGTLTAAELITESTSGYLVTQSDTIATPPGVLYVVSIWVNNVPAGTEVKALNGDGSASLADVTLPVDVTEWTRVSVPYTADATGFSRLLVKPNGSGVTFHVWGVQLEQGSFPTSYIPTAGTQVTRAVDNCSRALGDEFNPKSCTIYFRGTVTDTVGYVFSIGGFRCRRDAGVNFIILGADNTLVSSATVPIKDEFLFAFTYDSTSSTMTLVINGVAASATQTTDLNNFLSVGSFNGVQAANGTIKDFRIFPTALSETELITLTGGN